MTLVSIQNLSKYFGSRALFEDANLQLAAGSRYGVVGANGSGKSTFAKTLAGHPQYEVTHGEVSFDGQDLFELEADERARAGLFLAFQYPVELPGVTNATFLRHSVNAVRRANDIDELDPLEFDDFIREKLELVAMDPVFLDRSVNVDFSGGEKKRNEILQMAALEPKLALLDETDSGLDIDALRVVAAGVNALAKEDNAIVMVTHYQRLLDYIEPDFVHVLSLIHI